MSKKAKAARKPAKVSAATKAAQKSRKQSAARAAKKPNGKKLPAEIAAKVAAAPVAAIESSIKVQVVPFDKIEESSLNPRKTRDPQKVAELAESIAQDGIQQPLKLRPHPKKSGKFETVFGGSRLAAVGLLVKAGRAPAGYGVPAIVEACSDAQLIKLALIENIQRADMTPLEEGEAFVRLRKAGGSTEAVARELGKSQKWVQMRISLVEKLEAGVKEALRNGELSLFQAQALCKGEHAHQVELLEQVRKGWISSAADIVERLTEDSPPVKAAHFKLELYTAAGGELIEDEEGKDGGPWFADVALFERLQREAIDKTAEDLAGKWAWVKVMNRGAGQHFSEWEFNKSKDPKKAGAVIEIEYGGKVKVHTGLVAKASAKSPAAKAAKKATAKAKTGKEPPQLTQPLLLHAKHRKTEALQDAIAFDPQRRGKAAVVLTCIALMGEDEVARIRPSEIKADDRALSPLLRDALEGFRQPLDGLLAAAPRGKDAAEGAGELRLKDKAAGEAFRRLFGWETESLGALFTCLIAARCGTFNGFNGPELGDGELARTMAELLAVDMPAHWSRVGADGAPLVPGEATAGWPAYLGLCKKSRLVRLVQQMPGLELDAEEAAGWKTDALVKQINVALELHPEQKRLLPPELTFGEGKAIEAAINKVPAKAAKAEKPAKDGKAAPAGKAGAKAAKSGKGKGLTVTHHKLDGTVEVRELAGGLTGAKADAVLVDEAEAAA